MQKSVKIVITNINDIDGFYDIVKDKTSVDGLEGLAVPVRGDEIEIFVCGTKDRVDQFVDTVDQLVIDRVILDDQAVDMWVEPFFKEEDYHGVFRFIKHRFSE